MAKVRPYRLALLALATGMIATASAGAQEVVSASEPEKIGVTIYRDPDRAVGDELELEWLRGYALVTETRTVEIPAGRAVIRFEGVAAGMLPESAIVTGLPDGVREKNLDADLLAPYSLYARSLGRPVTLRREDPKTGAVREEEGVIRSGPDGAAILQTRDGFEAVNCGPLGETILYPEVPEGLSPRPTLSVETRADAPVRATVQLSYLAWGFDWQTNYVVTMNPDGRSASMLAWVTLASSDSTSFVDAETAVVGGKVNREDSAPEDERRARSLQFKCYYRPVPPPPAPLAQGPYEIGAYDADAAIVVTAMRRDEMVQSVPIAVTVIEEGLGDLKLYRVPVPTTVAAKAQKQVAMFQLSDVRLDVIYRSRWAIDFDSEDQSPTMLLRTRNTREKGLGRALPAGAVSVFEGHHGTPILFGEGSLADSAVGQKVEIELGDATQVTVTGEEVARDPDDRWTDRTITVANANPWPVVYEGEFFIDDDARLEKVRGRIERRDGRATWKAKVPANATAQLRFRLRYPRDL